MRKLLSWAFSFFPSAKSPTSPIIQLTPKQLDSFLPVTYEGHKPMPGNEWNPLIKYPRNSVCYCGSKIKAKKCCIPKQPLAIDSSFAAAASPLVKTMRSEARR